MGDGFLGRWAKRKEAVRKGEAVPAEAPRVLPPPPSPVAERRQADAPVVEPSPAPTLDDAQALTPQSDFTPFTRPDVAADVRNTAMKKLFADPHFNVMDGLDVYIDDYSKPDPIPPGMLRQLASARFLKLFDEPEEPGQDPAGTPPQTVAQSCTLPRSNEVPHADPDLQLQQDHAPGPRRSGQGIG